MWIKKSDYISRYGEESWKAKVKQRRERRTKLANHPDGYHLYNKELILTADTQLYDNHKRLNRSILNVVEFNPKSNILQLQVFTIYKEEGIDRMLLTERVKALSREYFKGCKKGAYVEERSKNRKGTGYIYYFHIICDINGYEEYVPSKETFEEIIKRISTLDKEP